MDSLYYLRSPFFILGIMRKKIGINNYIITCILFLLLCYSIPNITNFHEVNYMDYMKVSEAAEKWKLSARRVRILCQENRIEGVIRKGNLLMVMDVQEDC